MTDKATFEQLGGRRMLEKVAKNFYDKVYKHPWIGLYFKDVPQDVIESQQVDFMSGALGGPKAYFGKLVIPAHKHMMITEDLFDLRKELLNQAMDEVGASDELRERWNAIDEAFRPKIVKKSLADCKKRFFTDEIMNFKKPYRRIA